MSVRLVTTAVIASALVASVAAQAPVDWSRAPTVQVELKSFAFTPETIRLKAGAPVRLTLRDTKGGHNFAAPAFFAAAAIAPEDRARIRDGKIELERGDVVTIRIVPAAGTYKLACTHFLHSGFGMKGAIVVS